MSEGASSPRRCFLGFRSSSGHSGSATRTTACSGWPQNSGCETFAQYDDGETSYELDGSGVLREKDFRARFAGELAELERVLRRLDELAAEVPVEAPWLAPRAAEWDVITRGHLV